MTLGGIHIAHCTRSRCSMKTTSASSQSCASSKGYSSQFPQIEEGGGPGGEELDDELMFDIDVNLDANDKGGLCLGAPRCRSCRPIFLPFLSRVEAHTGKVDDIIDDTHLQHGLKRHPFAQTRKAQVCSLFSFNCQI